MPRLPCCRSGRRKSPIDRLAARHVRRERTPLIRQPLHGPGASVDISASLRNNAALRPVQTPRQSRPRRQINFSATAMRRPATANSKRDRSRKTAATAAQSRKRDDQPNRMACGTPTCDNVSTTRAERKPQGRRQRQQLRDCVQDFQARKTGCNPFADQACRAIARPRMAYRKPKHRQHEAGSAIGKASAARKFSRTRTPAACRQRRISGQAAQMRTASPDVGYAYGTNVFQAAMTARSIS